MDQSVPGITVAVRRQPEAFGYRPSLDGVRAVAVVLVMFFHARFSFASGWFLGIPVFFTLSGFLITSLLLRESMTHGSIELKAFWLRRIRRLTPASMMTLAAIVIAAGLGVWDADQLRDLRRHVFGALAQVANLVFIAGGDTYGDQFASPSPVRHYWSLAIEEQFYLVFPLVLVGLLRISRSQRWVPPVVLAAAAVASAWWCGHLAAENIDRAYFGTDTRLAELLVGVVAAFAFQYRLEFRKLWLRWMSIALGVAGIAGLVVALQAATLTSQWVYPWGLLATSVCTMAIVIAVLQPGPLQCVFSVRPLVEIGRISYGLYLFHWPIYLWLTPERIDVGQWQLFGIRMAVTFSVAWLSYFLLEEPIRRRRWLTGRRAIPVFPVGALAVAIGAMLLINPPPPTDFEVAAAQEVPDTVLEAVAPTATRILVVGDSRAADIADGFEEMASPDLRVQLADPVDCGFVDGGFITVADVDPEVANNAECASVKDRWIAADAEFRPDAVLVVAGRWEVADRLLRPGGDLLAPGNEVLDTLLLGEMNALSEDLAAGGADVWWTTAPQLDRFVVDEAGATVVATDADPARTVRFNELVNESAEQSDGVQVADLAGWSELWPGGPTDPEIRADGVGFTETGAELVAEWLAPQLESARREAPELSDSATQVTDVADNLDLPPAPDGGPRLLPAAGEDAHILFVGDSVAYGYGGNGAVWAESQPNVLIENGGQFNCPVARGGTYRFIEEVDEFPDRCDWSTFWPQWIADRNAHLVVLNSGIWEIVDRILPGSTSWQHIGEPQVDQYFVREMVAAIDVLSAGGARVVLLTNHHIEAGANQGYQGLPESDPARVDRLNELMVEVQRQRPETAAVVDVASYLEDPNGPDHLSHLKDGLHFEDDYYGVIMEWLGPELLRLVGR